ncbi:protein OSB1, mitochondrial-like isoform X2 [Ananas comosus]|uniref:Protein OSB1, mitochondrial-like isoform X2 n=1 Tax=Ananas comosus TaxID=4615 RepID=A0A6P5FE97_ANACO|nr:protein OSB1, mitochondrial-like isoform X2 [Ananas comosus]
MATPPHSYSSLSSLRRFLRPLPSPPSLPVHRTLGGGGGSESMAYRRSMLRAPPTVRAPGIRRNSCSFIGTVVAPVRRAGRDHEKPWAYTFLEVKRQRAYGASSSSSSSSSPSSFEILLAMRDKLAEISLRHLQPNDFIYVSGPLGSYAKVNASGSHEICYKVFVMDLNYVKHNDQKQTSHKHEVLVQKELTGPTFGAFDSAEKDRERLHLWHVFFANPYEWWDNRQSKPNIRHPDFKHKGTGEVLWLNPHDPPWVKKQLELYDSKMGLGTNQRNDGRRPELHGWIIEDFE